MLRTCELQQLRHNKDSWGMKLLKRQLDIPVMCILAMGQLVERGTIHGHQCHSMDSLEKVDFDITEIKFDSIKKIFE